MTIVVIVILLVIFITFKISYKLGKRRGARDIQSAMREVLTRDDYEIVEISEDCFAATKNISN